MSFLIWVVLPVGKAIQKQTTEASIRTVLKWNFLGGPMLMGGTGHETRWPFTLLFLSTVPTVGMMPSLRRTNTDMVQQSCQPRRLCRYERGDGTSPTLRAKPAGRESTYLALVRFQKTA